MREELLECKVPEKMGVGGIQSPSGRNTIDVLCVEDESYHIIASPFCVLQQAR